MSFYHDIKQQLETEEDQIDPVQNCECFKRAVDGSEEAIQEFIMNNMRLATIAVDHFRNRYPISAYLIDDMFSEGLLVLTRAVRTLVKYLPEDAEKFRQGLVSLMGPVKIPNFNIPMYIYVSIYRAVQQLYEQDSSDPISDRFRIKHTAKGQKFPTRKVSLDGFIFENTSCDPFQEIYLLEDIMDACQTDDEHFIIGKRHEGYIDREIAEELNCDRSYVTRVKNRVYKRFCEETCQ